MASISEITNGNTTCVVRIFKIVCCLTANSGFLLQISFIPFQNIKQILAKAAQLHVQTLWLVLLHARYVRMCDRPHCCTIHVLQLPVTLYKMYC